MTVCVAIGIAVVFKTDLYVEIIIIFKHTI